MIAVKYERFLDQCTGQMITSSNQMTDKAGQNMTSAGQIMSPTGQMMTSNGQIITNTGQIITSKSQGHQWPNQQVGLKRNQLENLHLYLCCHSYIKELTKCSIRFVFCRRVKTLINCNCFLRLGCQDRK